eukprot:CAMPEP_0171793106 /NCGR_PEP_ID=MMETSP0991-20121206/67365_1 /TAXON_ID=483369 /ORGANISM="non described non described, Strain CCMP2098" /LENGTH=81 /DNA_ID=CAMNT_0012403319 /DNA_START=1 /DNA_END=242 /DNA_ORIENTATION=+
MCSALGLASTNATLGRKMVSLALKAQDKAGPAGVGGFETFEEQSTQFGSFGSPLLRDVYGKVGERRRRAILHQRTGGKGVA